jgi:hypothetical protein
MNWGLINHVGTTMAHSIGIQSHIQLACMSVNAHIWWPNTVLVHSLKYSLVTGLSTHKLKCCNAEDLSCQLMSTTDCQQVFHCPHKPGERKQRSPKCTHIAAHNVAAQGQVKL